VANSLLKGIQDSTPSTKSNELFLVRIFEIYYWYKDDRIHHSIWRLCFCSGVDLITYDVTFTKDHYIYIPYDLHASW